MVWLVQDIFCAVRFEYEVRIKERFLVPLRLEEYGEIRNEGATYAERVGAWIIIVQFLAVVTTNVLGYHWFWKTLKQKS